MRGFTVLEKKIPVHGSGNIFFTGERGITDVIPLRGYDTSLKSLLTPFDWSFLFQTSHENSVRSK